MLAKVAITVAALLLFCGGAAGTALADEPASTTTTGGAAPDEPPPPWPACPPECDGPPDRDADGVPDTSDNCPDHFNPGQENTYGDGRGDACESPPPPDRDGDGVPDQADNCPDNYNPGQENTYGDGRGDACEPPPDSDGDGIPDYRDNCPNYYSPDNHCDWEATGFYSDDERSNPATYQVVSATGETHWCTYYRKSAIHDNLVRRDLFKYHLKVDYCWIGTKLTRINVRAWPQIVVDPWKFEGHILYDVKDDAENKDYYPNWGRNSFEVFAQGGFSLCMPFDIDICRHLVPWVEITVYAGGRYIGRAGGV